jgi:tRNA G18 (ribose-2'-O)-methylase SpoU
VLLLDNKNSILEALLLHPDQVKRIWIEAGYESVAKDVVQEARKQGVSFRVISREEFAKRFRGIRSRICMERESFSYRDPDVLLNEPFHCSSRRDIRPSKPR